MLNDKEQHYIFKHAYLPEHLPGYVCAIHGAQPHLIDNFICFTRNRYLRFIGYPLNRSLPSDARDAYQKALKRFEPTVTALVAEKPWLCDSIVSIEPAGTYGYLSFPPPAIPGPLADRVRQARKKVHLSECQFGPAHRKLIDEFSVSNNLSSGHRSILQHIGDYCRTTPTVTVLQATKAKQLVAFNIIDFGSADHAFFQFHFRCAAAYVPDCTDLLFDEMLYRAQAQGKKGLNLGLGIHTGVRQYKEKWGGRPYLNHQAVYGRPNTSLGQRLLEAFNMGLPLCQGKY